MQAWRLAALLVLPAAVLPRAFADDSELQAALTRMNECKKAAKEGVGPCRSRRPADDIGAGKAFHSADAAAVGFVDYVRAAFADQRIEYCAYVVRNEKGVFAFTEAAPGDANHCPTRPKPAGMVAAVHTHPLWGRSDDLTAPAQMFSDNDLLFAVRPDMNVPVYLGAPAGHILRYAPGASTCRGKTWVQHRYSVVRGPKPGASGKLPFEPSEFVATPDGKPQPFCLVVP